MTTVAVIDFETAGISPALGDRATEIAIFILEGGNVVDRYLILMNARVRISPFIESFTGISDEMIAATRIADGTAGLHPLGFAKSDREKLGWSLNRQSFEYRCRTPMSNIDVPHRCLTSDGSSFYFNQ